MEAHEARILWSSEKIEEKALQIEEEIHHTKEAKRSGVREHDRDMSRDRHAGRERGRHLDARPNYNGQRNSKLNIQCHNYKKFEHIKKECWLKEKSANLAKEKIVSNLFMAQNYDTNLVACNLWLLDSGCSNHMIGVQELFNELDETRM